MRLAHGWRLTAGPDVPEAVIREYIRPAVRAVPRALASRLKSCRVSLPLRLAKTSLVSQWSETGGGLEIEVAAEGLDGHDLALEVLLCLGQAAWEYALVEEREAWLKLLAVLFTDSKFSDPLPRSEEAPSATNGKGYQFDLTVRYWSGGRP